MGEDMDRCQVKGFPDIRQENKEDTAILRKGFYS